MAGTRRFRAAIVCACHAWSAPHHPVQTLASPRRRGTISEARFAPLQVQRPHRRRRTNSLNIQAGPLYHLPSCPILRDTRPAQQREDDQGAQDAEHDRPQEARGTRAEQERPRPSTEHSAEDAPPTMPRRPPGVRPGISALASPPATSPTMIQLTISPMSLSSSSVAMQAVLAATGATRHPAYPHHRIAG